MSNERDKSRRRFLAATASAGFVGALAGCEALAPIAGEGMGSGGNGRGNGSGEPGGPAGEVLTIEYGETITETLESGDGRDPSYNDLAQPVTFQGEAGQRVGITMESGAFDAYLVLEGPDGSIVGEDDDGAGNLDSRLVTTLDQSGQYTIWAGSVSGQATGQFTLALERVEATTEERSIGYGETIQGRITGSSGRDPRDGDLAQPVTFEGSDGDTVTITMESDAIDPYLKLEGPNGTIVAENDDGASGYNSQLTTTLTQSGQYTIWAGSYSGNAIGGYTLRLQETTATTEDRSIEYGQTIESFIRSGSGREPVDGDLAQPVTFEGSEGDTVAITMSSDPIDPYLILQAPDGTIVGENDDGATGYNSLLTVTLTQSGQYTIWATSYGGNETGPYTLTLERFEPRDGELSIGYGETIQGRLTTESDREPVDGDLAQPVTFEGSEGDTVEITMNSDPIDPYLILQAPDGTIVGENDDGASGYNSRLTVTLTQSGQYTIWATSYGGNETGPYTLTLERGQ